MRSMNSPTDLPAYVRYRPGVVSRAITAENPDGAPNAGGTAASPLGPGRKGRAFLPLPAGGTLTLADIDGPGVIRHIWITVPDQTPDGPYVLRDLVLTVHWDHDPQPAIQVPLGDFFGNGFATRAELTSAAMVVAPSGGMNCYLPMPFRRHATITITSDHPGEVPCVFFQIDYTLGDDLGGRRRAAARPVATEQRHQRRRRRSCRARWCLRHRQLRRDLHRAHRPGTLLVRRRRDEVLPRR